jgi:hypothetical protein
VLHEIVTSDDLAQSLSAGSILRPVSRQKTGGGIEGTAGTRQILRAPLKDVVQSLEDIETNLAALLRRRGSVAPGIIEQQLISSHLNGERR